MGGDITPIPIFPHDVSRDKFNFAKGHQGNLDRKIWAWFGIYL
jgi:hypothetical protein